MGVWVFVPWAQVAVPEVPVVGGRVVTVGVGRVEVDDPAAYGADVAGASGEELVARAGPATDRWWRGR